MVLLFGFYPLIIVNKPGKKCFIKKLNHISADVMLMEGLEVGKKVHWLKLTTFYTKSVIMNKGLKYANVA